MKIGDWLKRKMAILAIATANVEKNAFSNEKNLLSDGMGTQRKMESGRLSDDLLKGEVTQQVEELRWRMYKILQESEKYSTQITGTYVDADGDKRNYTTTGYKTSAKIDKIKLEPSDDYPLEYLINNEKVILSFIDGMGNGEIVEVNEQHVIKVVGKDKEGKDIEEGQRTVGEIDFKNLESGLKQESAIMVNREYPTKFNIENFTKTLYVRTINDNEKLLEFFISKYVDEYDRKTTFLISELKKLINNPRASNIIDIIGVGLITNSETKGVDKNKLFEYEIIKFDKIVEFGGYYVIKFKANQIIGGENIYEKYRVDSLDDKYNNMEKKTTL